MNIKPALIGSGLAALLCFATLATADEPIKAPPAWVIKPPVRTDSEAERRIEAALNDNTSLEFIETPLQDACVFITELHKITVQYDTRALRAADLNTDTPVTFHAKGLKLKSALALMLQAEGMAFMVQNEALLITTPQEVSKAFQARVYDLSALVTGADAEEPVTADTISEAVTGTIAVNTWSETGGNGSAKALNLNGQPLLVINQTYDVHQKILRLLTDLQDASRR